MLHPVPRGARKSVQVINIEEAITYLVANPLLIVSIDLDGIPPVHELVQLSASLR